MSRQRVAQIYVQSEHGDDVGQRRDYSVTDNGNINNLREQFSISRELEEAMEETKSEKTAETEPEFTYESMGHYYREQLANDITSCSKVPSVLLEMIGSVLSIVNIAVAYKAFYDISFETTNLKYREYARDDGVINHGEALTSLGDDVNMNAIHIYGEAVFINWRNFVHLGLSLIIVEVLAPLLRIVIVTDRAPKKINTLHTIVQISLLTALVLEDGAVSLCKNMLFAEECEIRPAMMSTISQVSTSLCFVNSMYKSILFMWRSNYRTQRAVRDEMETYTEILILEEYQWYHCIIPILAHIAVISISIWSLIDATSPVLLCVNN